MTKMFKEMWRLGIDGEEWEFQDKEEYLKVHKQIVDLKEKYGKVKKDG